MVFRWLAIPWIQNALDRWIILRNRTALRSNTKKVLPHGIPELIQQKPEQFNVNWPRSGSQTFQTWFRPEPNLRFGVHVRTWAKPEPLPEPNVQVLRGFTTPVVDFISRIQKEL